MLHPGEQQTIIIIACIIISRVPANSISHACMLQKGCYSTNGHSAKVYNPRYTVLLEYFVDEKPLQTSRKVDLLRSNYCVLARCLLGFAIELINPRKVRMYNAWPPTSLALIIRYTINSVVHLRIITKPD